MALSGGMNPQVFIDDTLLHSLPNQIPFNMSDIISEVIRDPSVFADWAELVEKKSTGIRNLEDVFNII